MARKEISEKVFEECLIGKIKLFGEIAGNVYISSFSDKGSQDYSASARVDFGGPFFKTFTSGGYESQREAEEGIFEVALNYFERKFPTFHPSGDFGSKKICLKL